MITRTSHIFSSFYSICFGRQISGHTNDQLFQNRLDVTQNTGSTCRRNYLGDINVDVDVKMSSTEHVKIYISCDVTSCRLERVSDVLEKRCASIFKARQSKRYDIQEI